MIQKKNHSESQQTFVSYHVPPVCTSRLRDLGLQQYKTVELFARILLPAAFLLACILQLHYFNSDFLALTDLDNIPVRQVSR